ncbi:MAG: hypothetical protein LBR34_03440 [Prevotella sp.]|jgi:hypothetical protein|nr:hypothetical protein [Prevotella sp.]
MRVYHGSYMPISEIDLSKCEANIAFCTLRSLQMLKLEVPKEDLILLNFDIKIPELLVEEFELPEEKAIELYFSSNTYRQLINTSNLLFRKSVEEIYQLLKEELNL